MYNVKKSKSGGVKSIDISASDHNVDQVQSAKNTWVEDKSTTSSNWVDSGVCITDSGLSIQSIDYEEDKLSNDENEDDIEHDVNDDEIIAQKRRNQEKQIENSSSLIDAAYTNKDIFNYQQDQDGDTFLHLAVIHSLTDVAYALIRNVPHPDLLDIYNHLSQTPLHLAALTRQPKIVRRLVVAGATVDLRDRHGNTAMHIACEQGDLDCVMALIVPITQKEIAEAAIVNYPIGIQSVPMDVMQIRNYEGESCMHLAAYNGNKKIIKVLLLSGADISAQEGKSGKTILHWAVDNLQVDLVQFLLKNDANVNAKTYAGHTPLYLAWSLLLIQPNSRRVRVLINLLREHGGEPQMPPNDTDEDDSDLSEEDDNNVDDHTERASSF